MFKVSTVNNKIKSLSWEENFGTICQQIIMQI